MVNSIQKKISSTEGDFLGKVKIGSKDVVIPKEHSFKLRCTTHCGPVSNTTLALFEPNLSLDLESDLVVDEGIVVLEPGKTKILIPVSNL